MTIATIRQNYNISERLYYWQLTREEERETRSFSIDDPSQKIDDVLMHLKKYNCIIEDEERIKSFLKNHQGIIEYLSQTPKVVFGYFGKTDLNLKLSYDPEIENDGGELFLYIKTNLMPKDAHNKLNQIDTNWLLNIREEDMAFFNFNLRFI